MSVYFAQRQPGSLIKIGWSRSVSVRMIALNVRLLGSVPGEQPAERAMHEKFAHLRVRARHEWFIPTEELLEYIRTQAQESPDEEMVPKAIRYPSSFLFRIDRLAKEMSTRAISFTRVRVLRHVTFLGVEQLETEQLENGARLASTTIRKREPLTQIAIRFPAALMDRIDKLMSGKGPKTTCAELLRVAAFVGTDRVERKRKNSAEIPSENEDEDGSPLDGDNDPDT